METCKPNQNCSNCWFSVEVEEGGWMECHRNAPISNSESNSVKWPNIFTGWWCGEWESDMR